MADSQLHTTWKKAKSVLPKDVSLGKKNLGPNLDKYDSNATKVRKGLDQKKLGTSTSKDMDEVVKLEKKITDAMKTYSKIVTDAKPGNAPAQQKVLAVRDVLAAMKKKFDTDHKKLVADYAKLRQAK